MVLIGQVYKVQSDKYLVKCENQILTCNSRGNVKKRGDSIVVGDFVRLEDKVIVEVLERKNRFIRPNVSNVDQIVLLISPEPKPDFYLIDKVLVNAVKEGVKVTFAINKIDNSTDLYDEICLEYKDLNLEICKISAKTGQGVQELKERLKGKLSVLVGQSAVGKTSLVNAMFNLNLKTGELSDIGRGKHTTTRSEIYEIDGIKVVDSPGFAVIDADVSAEDFPEYYEEYFNVSSECRFRGCRHIDEPDCKVKQLVAGGLLSRNRYQRYTEIYQNLLKRRKIYEKD